MRKHKKITPVNYIWCYQSPRGDKSELERGDKSPPPPPPPPHPQLYKEPSLSQTCSQGELLAAGGGAATFISLSLGGCDNMVRTACLSTSVNTL